MSIYDSALKQLRAISWIEGISYLALLGIAMPMKYLADDATIMRSVGMVHGMLFVLFIVKALQAKIEYSWTIGRMLLAIGTALLPFGMVLLDRMVVRAKAV